MKKKFSWLVVFLTLLLTQLAFAADGPPQSNPPHVSASKAAPAQHFYRCTGTDGRSTYTDSPCSGEGERIKRFSAGSSQSSECQGMQEELEARLRFPSLGVAPTAPAYLAWLQEQIDSCKRRQNGSVDVPKKDGGAEGAKKRYPTGRTPSPIDWSRPKSNPPRPLKTDKEPALPTSYDLRSQNRLPPVRNQEPFGTCVAHAAIGSAESNAISQGFDDTVIQRYA